MIAGSDFASEHFDCLSMWYQVVSDLMPQHASSQWQFTASPMLLVKHDENRGN